MEDLYIRLEKMLRKYGIENTALGLIERAPGVNIALPSDDRRKLGTHLIDLATELRELCSREGYVYKARVNQEPFLISIITPHPKSEPDTNSK